MTSFLNIVICIFSFASRMRHGAAPVSVNHNCCVRAGGGWIVSIDRPAVLTIVE